MPLQLRSDANSAAYVFAGTDEYIFRQGGGSAANPKDVVTTGMSKLASAVAQASTSGTFLDFTGIPPWAKRITLMLANFSTNGSSLAIAQLGTSAGFQTSGYGGAVSNAVNTTITSGAVTNGIGIMATPANIVNGQITITKVDGNTWVAAGLLGYTNTGATTMIAAGVTLSGTLDRVRITTTNGTDAFDLGLVNIMWE